MIDIREVAERVHAVRQEITECGGSGVSLVAVTKTFGFEAIEAARSGGCDAVGENYAQELLAKLEGQNAGLPVHFIGSIQSNKVKSLAPVVSLWQTVDRESVVNEIARRSAGAQVLLQVNTTGESSKGGVAPENLDALRTLADARGLTVQGLMTIGPTGGSHESVHKAFTRLRELTDLHHLPICSMGMSDDFRIAVSCGSTMIRVGSRLFGARQ